MQNVFEKDLYFVAVKVFLEHEGKLLILKDNFGDWDLPGGRIKKEEFNSPLEKILERKMKEELGVAIKYEMSELPVLFMRHERNEAVEGSPLVRIFALGYKAELKSGQVELSPRHTEMLWAEKQNFKPEQYFAGGWLAGVKEYLEK